ncbi:MAG: dienelactone hydrolase family protein [Verrucomicrobia bacterium]|nr:dienelactone hydrolase family protein [Verrucomicrobiota bacterium]
MPFESADFTSGGKKIRLDLLLPAPAASKPPVILLAHGANGTGEGPGPGSCAALAQALQQRGFAVAVVHYFDRTGVTVADAASPVRDLPLWYTTLTDAVGALAKHPAVDRRRIHLLGISLGGTLAVTVAAFDPRVQGLVSWFGGFQPATESQIKRLPPTLVLHGEQDRVVPVEQARRLAAVAQRLGGRHELKIYPDSGHGFQAADQQDAIARVAAFLQAAK